jgi:hypothetical protein
VVDEARPRVVLASLAGETAGKALRVEEVVRPDESVDGGQPSAMRGELGDGDLALAVGGELRPIASDRLVELERSSIGKHQQAQRDEALGSREDDLNSVGRPGPSRRAVGDASPQIDDKLTVQACREGGANLAALSEVPLEFLDDWLEARGNGSVDDL